MIWSWSYAVEIFPTLLSALGLTIVITALAAAGSLVLGIPIVLVGRAKWPPIRLLVRLFVDFIRGTPLIIQVFFAYYVLPRYGLTGTALVVGTSTLAVNYAPYMSEAYRGGINSIGREYLEAARALHFRKISTWRVVVLPLAVRRAVPSLATYIIAMYKDTAALFVIGVPILFEVAENEGIDSYRFLEPYTIAGFLYFAVSYSSAMLTRRLERRYG